MGAFSDRVFAVVKQIPRGKGCHVWTNCSHYWRSPVLRVMSVMLCAQTLLLEQILRQSLATASYSKMGAWQPDFGGPGVQQAMLQKKKVSI